MKALFIRAAVFAISVFLIFSCPIFTARADTAVTFRQVINKPSYSYFTKEECGSSVTFYFSHKCCICRDLSRLSFNIPFCSDI